MKVTEFLDLVNNRITYKPDVSVRAEESLTRPGEVTITLTARVIDASRWPLGHYETSISVSEPVQVFTIVEMDRDAAARMIRRIIWKMEEHEIDEFYRVDGIHWANPHSERRQTPFLRERGHQSKQYPNPSGYQHLTPSIK